MKHITLNSVKHDVITIDSSEVYLRLCDCSSDEDEDP